MDLLGNRRFNVSSYGVAAGYVSWLLRSYGAAVHHQSALDPEGIGAFLALDDIHTDTPDLAAPAGIPFVTDAPVSASTRATLEALALTNPILWITPWGLDNPWAERPWSDLALCAAGGWMSAVGEPGREPLAPPGPQPQLVAGLFTTIHALAALAGPGLTVVSMAESVAATMIYDSLAFQYYGVGRERAGHRFTKAQCTLMNLPCKDGFVGINAALHHQFVALCGLVGHPELVSDPRFATLAARMQNVLALDAYVVEWLADKTRFEAYHALQAARIPGSPLPHMGEVLDSPQLAARGFWQEVETEGGHHLRVPGDPVRVVAEGSPALPAEGGPWEPGRLRVVDFSMGWAGPLVSHVLACYGADVIKLESHRRFDWWRGSRPPGDNPGNAIHERSHVFNTVNRGKRGLTLDVTTPEGYDLARKLMATADVVIENYTAGVLPKLGLDYATLVQENPRLVMLRQPGFGTTGPERDYLVFGNTIEGMSGLTSMVGYSDSTVPFQMSNAFGDPVSGLNGAVAVLAALAARDRDGRGRCIEAAQLEGFLPMVSAELIDYQRTGDVRHRAGNARAGFALSTAVECAEDDRWAVVQASEAAVRAVEAATGGVSPREWARSRSRDEVVEVLGSIPGVRCVPVNTEADVLSCEPFASTNFWHGMEREPVGFHLYPSLPVTSAGERPQPLVPAPTLGQHNAEILAALGVDAAGLERLRACGVIGETPA